uniref:Uncharacterized protein n=1 Tax=Oryza brachyantha TaxID=4533 RepID=J3LF95_ORYBR
MGLTSKVEPMKQRVNRCLLQLSDREVIELDVIACRLEADELSVFLTMVSDTRPTNKTPLRQHSLRWCLTVPVQEGDREGKKRPNLKLAGVEL